MRVTIPLTDDTASSFVLGDAKLMAITWLSDGRDLQLDLLLSNHRCATLTCTWASGVRVDLSYEARGGGLALSWECRFERYGSSWHMVFEFPPNGSIALQCNDARLEYDDAR